MVHRLAPEAEIELDQIWYRAALESGSAEIADRITDAIADRFLLLAAYPHVGRLRDDDLRPGLRSVPVGEYVIIYRTQGEDVSILHIVRGSRDIQALLHD
jgi:toxin ParE1/3/4